MKEDKNILNTIWQQKHKWLEQVLRNEVLLREIIEGRLSAKCSVEERHYKLMKRCIISKVSRSKKGSRRSRKMQHYKQNRNGTNVLYSRQLEEKEEKKKTTCTTGIWLTRSDFDSLRRQASSDILQQFFSSYVINFTFIQNFWIPLQHQHNCKLQNRAKYDSQINLRWHAISIKQ